MRDLRPHYALALPAAGFVLLCGVYYLWGWSHVLGDFGGDNAVYLLTAKHYSPWSDATAITASFFRNPYPPLYPLVLALFGGGESLLAAHLVTVTFLLLGFIAFYAWLRAQNLPRLDAGLLVLLFAILPGTYMQTLDILSENLYLLLTLACLASVSAYEQGRKASWLWAAALCLAASMLTRSAGVSLLAAFALYLLWHRPPRFWLYAAVAIAPALAWSLFDSRESTGYLAAFAGKYGTDPVANFLRQLSMESQALWRGWVNNLSGSNASMPLAAMLGILCLLGAAYRVYLRKLDGFYVAAYVALILVWPYPAEAQRFLFVIMPVLLAQGVMLVDLLPRLRLGRVAMKPAYPVMLAVSLIVIPELVLTGKRFLEPMPAEYAGYRHTTGWYMSDLREAREDVMISKSLVMHLNALKEIVPENACVYSIKPSVISYLSGRPSVSPPKSQLDAEAFNRHLEKTGCRYFYTMIFSSPSFPGPHYPLKRMQDLLQIVSVAPRVEGVNLPVGILAELSRPRSSARAQP